MTQLDPHSDLPQVVIRPRRGPSVVWIVPIAAALVAAWIWWTAVQEAGPTIVIRFETAAGLEAGFTPVKLKDVVVGQVARIDFEPDLSGVVVRAAMNDAAEPFLLDSTRFWVVKPRIGVGGIQGLETLVSGAFIAMDPGRTGGPRLDFEGFEAPPVAPVDAPGLKLTLTSDRLGGLEPSSPVLYLDQQVGKVERHRVLEDGSGVEIDLYIEPEYRNRVHRNTRFWNAGGLQVSLNTSGIDVRMESLASLLSGGVTFETFGPAGPPAVSGDRFPLLPDRQEAGHVHFEVVPVSMVFEESVRGLERGAPIEFMGLEVGEVTDFELVYQPDSKDFVVPVTGVLHQEFARVASSEGPMALDAGRRLDDLILNAGLRARLASGSLITGSLYVQLDLQPLSRRKLTGLVPGLRELPTVPSTASGLAKTLDEVPSIVADLRSIVATARSIVSNPALPELLARAEAIAQRAEQTLSSLQSSEGALSAQAGVVLAELSATLRSVRLLADLLERHPEVLLQGKEDLR